VASLGQAVQGPAANPANHLEVLTARAQPHDQLPAHSPLILAPARATDLPPVESADSTHHLVPQGPTLREQRAQLNPARAAESPIRTPLRVRRESPVPAGSPRPPLPQANPLQARAPSRSRADSQSPATRASRADQAPNAPALGPAERSEVKRLSSHSHQCIRAQIARDSLTCTEVHACQTALVKTF
jgi:hypothetical protein